MVKNFRRLFSFGLIFFLSVLILPASIFAQTKNSDGDIAGILARGELRVAITAVDQPPFYFVDRSGKLAGYDIDIATKMAEELGVKLVITRDAPAFNDLVTLVASGKADLGCGSIVISDERKETMDFVDYHPAAFILIVRAKSAEAVDTSFVGSIKSSFNKTFIRENRYKLFIQGILTTIIITVLSILFGTILGFLVYMLCRNGNKVANKLADISVWIVQGMPVVVLLMILYYIIFAKSEISGTFVAVIAFTLVFGVGVFGMLKMGIGAIDKGQKEAALALGYGDIWELHEIHSNKPKMELQYNSKQKTICK